MIYLYAFLAVVFVVAAPFALWMGFGIYRDDQADRLDRLDRQAAKLVHEARHDYVVAVGATNQRCLEAPTGALEPAEIVRLLGSGR